MTYRTCVATVCLELIAGGRNYTSVYLAQMKQCVITQNSDLAPLGGVRDMVDGSVNECGGVDVKVDAVVEVKGMANWYLYYRLLRELEGAARVALQDVLVDLRGKTVVEWPGVTDQEAQDFFEYLADSTYLFDERQAKHLVKIEGWVK